MSDACAGSSTSWFQRFDSVWEVDFEFNPTPVCMFARERRTGTTISLWGNELRALRRAPFGTGPNDLMVAFSATAELGCFAQLGWAFPHHVLDPYLENAAVINGRLDIWPPRNPETGKARSGEGQPGLLAALEMHGLPGMSKAEKDRMRDLILSRPGYSAFSNEERRAIQDYNRVDVEETADLLEVLAPYLDPPRALFRGRFIRGIAREETLGLPIDTVMLARLVEHWAPLQLHYIRRDDELALYDGTHFREGRLETLIAVNRWDWPRHPSGRLMLDGKTLGRQARRYPVLKKLVRLRNTIAELRISKLANTVGDDGFSRISMLPFWTRTGRNQPSARDGVFLPSLPGWLHGLLKPPPGFALAELDWDAQEVGIMAGLSGDPGMLEDYRSGDVHLKFGIRAGLIPADGTKESHGEVRQKMCKPVVLGSNYGMTAYGIAAKTGRSLYWARDIHARHRRAYPVFHQWLGDTVCQAKFDGRIESPFGWPMAVVAETRDRALMNFPAQAGGADAMRIATIAAVEAGIQVCASVHDAFWIMAPSGEIDDAIARMVEIMVEAGRAVAGLPITVTVEEVVHWPMSLGDRWRAAGTAPAMWVEVCDLLDSGLQRVGA